MNYRQVPIALWLVVRNLYRDAMVLFFYFVYSYTSQAYKPP